MPNVPRATTARIGSGPSSSGRSSAMAPVTTDQSSRSAPRRWWDSAWAYTWASQNTNRVASASCSGLACSGSDADPAITAMAAIVP
jgi:hypothetical protein